MTLDTAGKPGKPALVLTLLFLILFLGVADSQAILPILSLIAKTFQRSAGDLALVITAYAFSAAILNLLFGPLSDHVGRKPVLILGLSGFAFCAYGLGMTSAFPAFLVMRALMGVFAGILSTCVTAYVGDYFHYAVRGRAMGVVIASYFAALVVGVPAGAFIADRWGWHRLFFLTSMLAALLALATAWLLPALQSRPQDPEARSVHSGRVADLAGASSREARPARRDPNDGRGYVRLYLGFLSSSEQMAALVSGAFVSGATLALLTFVGPWLAGRYRLGSSEVGFVFGMVGGASVLASPLSGWISDVLGKRRLFLASSLAVALLVCVLPWIGDMRRLLIILFAAALMFAFRQTSQQALVTELIPASGRGSFIALRNCFSQVGIGISILIASPLFERYGFQGVALFSSFQSMLAAAFFLRVREPHTGGSRQNSVDLDPGANHN